MAVFPRPVSPRTRKASIETELDVQETDQILGRNGVDREVFFLVPKCRHRRGVHLDGKPRLTSLAGTAIFSAASCVTITSRTNRANQKPFYELDVGDQERWKMTMLSKSSFTFGEAQTSEVVAAYLPHLFTYSGAPSGASATRILASQDVYLQGTVVLVAHHIERWL